ncbi:hypothetical protein HRG_010005 [Hirsutella rhossiliensis]|uniref:Uncharacterized protein n=1 Tax=Hirsutella rhossiliensis TaxID=111463 RepID=A0A9P8MPL3_9HYPO|nr:uncharacterized protein HRG_10005 [Hirsutella rhossiliensis]KAH0958960.1 hypothetical protein HRG_10005 [Hirsutella rhossiliensis]
MQKIVSAVAGVHTDRMEVIHEYALPPWTSRIPVVGEDDPAKAVKAANDVGGIIVATSTGSSQKDGMVGMGGVVCGMARNRPGEIFGSYSVTLGPADEQNGDRYMGTRVPKLRQPLYNHCKALQL